MKKLLLLSLISTSLFSFDLFKNANDNKKQVESSEITNLLHKEVKLMELDRTKFKIINEDKYLSTGSNITDVHGEITISNADDTLSSLSFRLKKNVWYFVRFNDEQVFKFFEYTSSDKKLFNENNFYIKLLSNKTNVLFKTKSKFEPISFSANEIVKFVIMNDELQPKEFVLDRKFKGINNEK